MKKLFIISAIAISGLTYNSASAQVSIHVALGFPARRVVYAPAPVVVQQAPVYEQVYDNNDDYYYLPDVGAYYNVTAQCYYYNNGGAWVSAAYLPGAYRNYDWRNAPRYEIRASRPYLRDNIYRSRYNGHVVGEWARNDRHFYNGYANRDLHNNDQRFDNRDYNRNGQRFDNGGQNGHYQPSQPDRDQRGQGQSGQNRGQGGNQPSNQNGNHGDQSRGGNERFSQNSPQGGLGGHRMARF